MKCPSCGAEVQGKFCEYCGSEVSKEAVAIQCPKCGSAKVVFKRERVGTATKSTSHKTAFGTSRQKQSITQAVYRTVGVCQSCGHTWNPDGNANRSGRKTWLWVLGWICIFPVPLTILMLRKKNMKPAVKYGIIAAAWLLFFIIGMSGEPEAEVPQNDIPAYTESVQTEVTTEQIEVATSVPETTTPAITMDKYIEDIVEQYNAQTAEPLVFVEDFVPSNKDGSHYRVEFRLTAWENAVGKSYLIGDKVVDLVASPQLFGDILFRVYTNDTSLEQAIALIQGMSPIMDENLTAAELQKTITEVSTKKTANGYYYGKLGITLFGSDVKGYELMIKRD